MRVHNIKSKETLTPLVKEPLNQILDAEPPQNNRSLQNFLCLLTECLHTDFREKAFSRLKVISNEVKEKRLDNLWSNSMRQMFKGSLEVVNGQKTTVGAENFTAHILL
jgi:hypothetical protein